MGLNVFGHNDTARRLYDRLGFQVTSTSMKVDL
jgi:ribosomal protein S18 acetylase RimI-like enzyme